MSSSIFFRFKSQKDNLQITFDGTSLSVFEVKRDIITLSRLGDGTDFDLEIYSGDNNESRYPHSISRAQYSDELTFAEYDDDTTQIPRSSTVIARRLPASKPGAGKAARYVTGKMPVNARNAHRIESTASAASRNAGSAINGGKEMTEEEKLQAILNANDQSWKAEQEAASHKPVVRSYNKQAAVPDKPPPDNYRCYRCCEKGHWIQACPTNNDPTFDNRPRVKRTTGIPRSSLKVIDDVPRREDGTVDVQKLPPGVMLTANGEWVTSEADKASWAKFQEKQNAAAEKAKEAATDNQELHDRGLECSIHKGMFVEPTKTPCCGKTYCHDCIENALLDADLLCPNCGKQVLLDSLEPDDEMTSKMKAYDEEKKAERKEKEKEAGKSPAATGTPKGESPKAGEGKSPAANGVPDVKVSSAASTPTSRKRSADGELPNDRRPSNPAASMKRTNSSQGTPAPNQSKSNTPKPVQPPKAPAAEVAAFQKQMQEMQEFAATSMASMQNSNPAMMNPMMGFNPAMMGVNMGMNPMMGMPGLPNGMPNMNMQNMQGFNGMPSMNNMNGWGNQQMMGNQGWQGGNGNGRGGMQNGYGRGGMQGSGSQSDGPYMRPPVNQYRQRGRMNRPRSQDYRQV
jgi:protein MPE1